MNLRAMGEIDHFGSVRGDIQSSTLVRNQMKLLILDIDETLLYASESKLEIKPDYTCGQYFVYLRPSVTEFLDFVFSEFKIGIWTSSNELYAQEVMEPLLRGRETEFFWSRDRCTRKYNPDRLEEFYIKDLGKLKRKGYSLDSILMLDDTPEKLQRNYGNHIRVLPFEGDQKDQELRLLKEYLPTYREIQSVRKIEKRHWRHQTQQRTPTIRSEQCR